MYVSINLGVQIGQGDGAFTLHTHTPDGRIVTLENLNLILQLSSIYKVNMMNLYSPDGLCSSHFWF